MEVKNIKSCVRSGKRNTVASRCRCRGCGLSLNSGGHKERKNESGKQRHNSESEQLFGSTTRHLLLLLQQRRSILFLFLSLGCVRKREREKKKNAEEAENCVVLCVAYAWERQNRTEEKAMVLWGISFGSVTHFALSFLLSNKSATSILAPPFSFLTRTTVFFFFFPVCSCSRTLYIGMSMLW